MDNNEFDDDFAADEGDEDGNDGYGEEDEDDADFDANELLNLSDYQNKRKPSANAN